MGPATDKHQTPTLRLKLYVRAIIESKAWPYVVQGMQTVAWYPSYIQPLYNVLESFWIDHQN